MRAYRFAAILGTTLMAAPASATSLIDRDPDEIATSLTRIFVASFHCSSQVQVQHNVVDLVWDIHQLKTGVDPDSEEGKEAIVPLVNEADETATADRAAFCDDIVASYGPQGSSIAGLVQPR